MKNAGLTFDDIVIAPEKKGVLVDIDDTLYSYSTAHEVALNHVELYVRENLFSAQEFSNFKRDYRFYRDLVTQRLHSQGACRSRLFAFQKMFESAGLSNAYLSALLCDELYWKTLIAEAKPHPGAISFLQKCKRDEIVVCAVTDMLARFQILKLEKLKMTHLIDFLVTSEEVGVEKPDPKIFQAAIQKIKLDPCQLIMIGDSMTKDIEGAVNVGVQAYQVSY